MALLLNGEVVDGLSFICHRASAAERGRSLALKLKSAIARQQFEVNLQAAIGGKLIAKERLRLVPHATMSIEAKNQQDQRR